jgi:lipoprotein NlpI
MARSLGILSFALSVILPAMAALANDVDDCNWPADTDRSIKRCPAFLEGTYITRGNACLDKREYSKAIADYTCAIDLSPDSAPAYNSRGSAYLAKGEYGKAISDYNRAIELNPKDAITLAQLGAAKFDTGDFEAAGGLLRSLELKEDGHAMLYLYLARARAGEIGAAGELEANSGRLKTKEWPYAVIELYLGKRSLKLTLDAAAKPAQMCDAQFYIGEWYVLQNKPAEAQAALDKAVETCVKLSPEYASAQAELKRLKP